MGDTNIEWATKVWNPVTGCTKVSDGCRNCYAERMSKRLAGRAGYPEDGFKVTLHPDKLDEPLRWKKPAQIFVCSMGDLFHKDVPDSFLVDVMKTIRECPQHAFLVLTKRPVRMQNFFRRFKNLQSPSDPLKNVWLGVSVEDQKTADERIPLLLETPAAKRFVSYEPALGPVDFLKVKLTDKTHLDVLRGWEYNTAADVRISKAHSKLDWVIMGGESGPGARPMHPDWARSVRDQCQAAGVPFFFKQWGEWAPGGDDKSSFIMRQDGWEESRSFRSDIGKLPNDDREVMTRVGKARAGCLLDGKEHKERP